MKINLYWLSALMVASLFWYGYTYSLTIEVFFVQGYIGALIPSLVGLWLLGAGIVIGRIQVSEEVK